MYRSRKPEYAQAYRGFESLPLRQEYARKPPVPRIVAQSPGTTGLFLGDASPDAPNLVFLAGFRPRVLQIAKMPFRKAIFWPETEIKKAPGLQALRTGLFRLRCCAEGLGLISPIQLDAA